MMVDYFTLESFKLIHLSIFDVLPMPTEICINATSLVCHHAGNFIRIALIVRYLYNLEA